MVKKKPQTENKKPGIYNRILKWAGLALLVLLLIAGLVFRAPWKVITLLLIILAACTVLPKPYRKWFWLSLTAIVLALIIWVFLPEDNEGWRPYTFDEELAALEAKYAIPDSQNAATIYNNLLEDYDPNTMRTDFLDFRIRNLTSSKPWSSQDYPELAKWLQNHQNTIATLLKASKIQNCRFPIYPDSVYFSLWNKRRSAIRRWIDLLTFAANNDLGQNRTDQALEKSTAALQMAKHLCQQPVTMDILIGRSSQLGAFRKFMVFAITCDATEQQLDLIEQAMADIKFDWSSDRPGFLEYEKLLAKNHLGEYYETDSTGRIRLSRDPRARIRAGLRNALEKSKKDQKGQERKYLPEIWSNPNYWQRKLIKAKTILYWFYLPSDPQKGAEVIDQFYEKYYKKAGADFDWKKEPEKISPRFRLNFNYLIEHLVLDSSVAYNYWLHDIYLRVNTINRGSRLIIALRRYKNKFGQWPQTLYDIRSLTPAENFVDPINGRSFVYKLTEDNFTLYSTGKNNIDEAGELSSDSGADDWTIWPPASRKTKNEKAYSQQSNTQKDAIK